MHLSIIIPAFNEAKKIERDLKVTVDYLAADVSKPSEVLVVDDGSRDGTREVVERFIKNQRNSNPTIRLLSYGGNRGKGFAVRYGVTEAQGKIICFMDAGLCVPLHFLEVGIEKLDEGFDFAIASRRLPGTKIVRAQPFYRRVGSRVFWLLMKKFMGIQVTDTQCGFKLYKKEAAKKIFSRVTTDGFMFDIEALMIASELGFRGGEFAVQWSNDGDTRYNPLFGTLRNFKELAFIRTKLLARKYGIRGFEPT